MSLTWTTFISTLLFLGNLSLEVSLIAHKEIKSRKKQLLCCLKFLAEVKTTEKRMDRLNNLIAANHLLTLAPKTKVLALATKSSLERLQTALLISYVKKNWLISECPTSYKRIHVKYFPYERRDTINLMRDQIGRTIKNSKLWRQNYMYTDFYSKHIGATHHDFSLKIVMDKKSFLSWNLGGVGPDILNFPSAWP